MLEETGTWQPSSGGSRPVPIGSRPIGVSLQPAIPRRGAPQQSPLPLHQSLTIIAHSRSSEPIKCATAGCSSGRAPSRSSPKECHLYFARRVSFLSCADKAECADLLVAALDRACVTFLITAAELMPWREWPIFQECAGTLTRGLAAFAAVPLGRSLINKKCCLRFLEPFYLVCMVRQQAA
jgi:hypothetical protein